MKKGLVIALIVAGVFLAACGVLYPLSYLTRHGMQRGFDSFNSRERASDDFNDRRSNMPHGMRGWNRSASDEDFYLERWAAMLGISEEELTTRLDSGESLESIAESLGIEMPCLEDDADDDADLNGTPGSSYFDRDNGVGMCF